MVVGPRQRIQQSAPRRSMGCLWGIGGIVFCLLLLVGGGYLWMVYAFGPLVTYRGPSGPVSLSEHGGDGDIVAILRKVTLTKSGGIASLNYSPQPGDKYSFSYLSKSTFINKKVHNVTIPASGARSHIEFTIQQETGYPDIDAIEVGMKRDGKFGTRIIPCN